MLSTSIRSLNGIEAGKARENMVPHGPEQNLSEAQKESISNATLGVPDQLLWLRRRGVEEILIDLLTLLVATSCRKISDKRDRIFTLLGLADSNERIKLPADYTKSTYQVYQKATIIMLQHPKGLDALTISGTERIAEYQAANSGSHLLCPCTAP